jgi:hypothetical protein
MRFWISAAIFLGMIPTGAAGQPVKLPVVSADDLAIAPKKYLETAIEVRNAHCFHAGPSAYRCGVPNRTQTLSIFAKDVDTDETRKYIERRCSSIKDVNRPRCRFHLRFVPSHVEFDKIENFKNRTVLRPHFFHAVQATKDR